MHIYITNLKTSTDRRAMMEQQLRGSGLDYEFFDCVVGAELTQTEIEQRCNMAAINKHNEKLQWFNRGMIGCTMTNQLVYQDIINKQFEYALFLEDDTILPANLGAMLTHIEGMIQQGDVILLFWNAWGGLQLKRQPLNQFGATGFYAPLNYKDLTCGSAYVVTQKAARNMIAANTPIANTPDSWGFFCDAKAIDRLICAYPLAVQTADLKSTMNTGKLKGLSQWVHRYKIFPLYQYLRYRRRKLKQKSQYVTFVTT
jgi:glycosyl transferase, family 25